MTPLLLGLLAASGASALKSKAEPCAAPWAQCGGEGHTGPTCCVSGSYCKFGDRWHSQCVPGSEATPPPAPASLAPTAAPSPATSTSEAPASSTPVPVTVAWDGENLKCTHYWDCNGQGCDATTLQPWDLGKYVSPPGYGPQDPAEFGGAAYGERMWLTGAASDALSALMGDDDGCCGADPNDGGVGGCGKCALIQNPDAEEAEWTAVVMKKNRCPPHSAGCGASQPHFDIAAPGFDNLQYSTANVCGLRPGTGFRNQTQSAALGDWYSKGCSNTAECAHLCDQLPPSFRKGCKLFASWGWRKGNPDRLRYRAVACPPAFVKHVGAQFGPAGPTQPVLAETRKRRVSRAFLSQESALMQLRHWLAKAEL